MPDFTRCDTRPSTTWRLRADDRARDRELFGGSKPAVRNASAIFAAKDAASAERSAGVRAGRARCGRRRDARASSPAASARDPPVDGRARRGPGRALRKLALARRRAEAAPLFFRSAKSGRAAGRDLGDAPRRGRVERRTAMRRARPAAASASSRAFAPAGERRGASRGATAMRPASRPRGGRDPRPSPLVVRSPRGRRARRPFPVRRRPSRRSRGRARRRARGRRRPSRPGRGAGGRTGRPASRGSASRAMSWT